MDLKKMWSDALLDAYKINSGDKTVKVIPETPIVRPKKIPLLGNGKIHYPVYLILPENDTRHTRLIRFFSGDKRDTKPYYFLEFNGKIYIEEEIENFATVNKNLGLDGNLDKDASNVIFIDSEGKLTVGTLEFSERAKIIIKETDNLKMENRTYERIVRGNKAKFGTRPLDVLFLIATLGVVTMLIFWATFDGLPKVISVENAAARDAYITKNTPIVVNLSDYNLTSQGMNGIGVRLDRT